MGGGSRSEVIATRVEPILWAKLCAEAERHQRTLSEYVRLVLIEKMRAVGTAQSPSSVTTCISQHGSVRDAVTIPREAITGMTKLKNYVSGT
jgi:hypothetical protein